MAGLGRKVFTAGDVLTASDVQNYLMDQSVMYFAGTAARSSAIATPTTGMTTYIGTTGTATIPQIETYTGSTWQTPYGATLVAKADFSAVSSLIVDNVFTSAFDTYYVVLDCTCTVAQSFRFVYRDGSSDVATNYSYAFQYVNSAAGPSRVSGLSQTQMLFAAVGTNTQTVQTITNVAKAAPTSSTFQTASNFGAEVEMAQGGCINTNNTAYEGLKYFVSSGTFTGTIRIYGLRNS